MRYIESYAVTQHLLGLDLGQVTEPSALAVIEQTVTYGNLHADMQYAVRYLQRFLPGTPFPTIASRLEELCREQPLSRATILVDQTAVGRPVVNLLWRTKLKEKVLPVVLTTGYYSLLAETGGWLIPKTELAGTLQVVLQERRLHVAATLPEAALLVSELQTFRLKQPKLVSDVEQLAWREGPQDDLVFAVGMALWLGERSPATAPGKPWVWQSRCPWW